MATRTVTFNALTPEGDPVEAGTISAELLTRPFTVDGSTIEQYKVTATTDASGDASLTLVVPAGGVTGVSYRFTLTDTTRYELTVASGTSIAFADLLLVDTLPLVDGVTATLADLRTDVDANTAHAGGVTTFHGLTVSTASTVFGYLATPSLFSTMAIASLDTVV